jgi:hypothetical protein
MPIDSQVLDAILDIRDELIKQAATPVEPEPEFTPEELRQFARFGLDPKRLRFMNTLAQLRKGLMLEQELMDKSLQGKTTPTVSAGPEELAQFA